MTSRYLIEHGGRAEDHKSSGIWAATAAGSSAAMASAGGNILDLDDPRTQVRVREPFVADGPPLLLTHLHLDDDEVVVTSKMREARVYLDGPYAIYELPMGGRLTLSGNAAPLRLFATSEMHARRVQARQRQIRG
jgi:NAD+ kinase